MARPAVPVEQTRSVGCQQSFDAATVSSELWLHASALAGLGPLQALASGSFAGNVVSGQDIGGFWDTVVAWLVARAGEPRPLASGLQLHPRYGTVHGSPNQPQAATEHIVVAKNAFGTDDDRLTVEVV